MKIFKNYINKILVSTILGGLCFALSSCSDDNNSPENGVADTTVLVYAIATNSLSSNLVSDKNEMIKAAADIDLRKNNVLVFETKYDPSDRSKSVISLLRLVKTNESFGWETVKEYSNDLEPLDPSRITEVINYVTKNFESKNKGLVFWSHSTGSQPYLSSRSDDKLAYSFGQDQTASTANAQINVDVLADAVPDGMFDYIWFDSCYMGNIETLYEFRNKCHLYVGYPTEVLEYGLPYDMVLPYLVGPHPDIIYAAELFYKYYQNSKATIAVINMNNIEDFAKDCRNIFRGENNVNTSGFMKYTRSTTGPFYELGDYAKEVARVSDRSISDENWNSILEKIVLYKASTKRDFSESLIVPERYSGISAHVYSFGNDSNNEIYYKSLDWYKDVFAL